MQTINNLNSESALDNAVPTETPRRNFIGNVVVEFREQKKLTQRKVANLAGIPQAQLSMIETGKIYPAYNTLFKISKALDIDPLVFAFKMFNEIDVIDKRKTNTLSEVEAVVDEARNKLKSMSA